MKHKVKDKMKDKDMKLKHKDVKEDKELIRKMVKKKCRK